MNGNNLKDALEEDFSPKAFIEAVENAVNNFSFDYEGTALTFTEMSAEKQHLLQEALESCIFALANSDRVDGRNEVAAQICKKLCPIEDPLPEVGACFLRMHPTLQQSAMKLFCCYLDKAEDCGCLEAIKALRQNKGSRWYCFPLI